MRSVSSLADGHLLFSFDLARHHVEMFLQGDTHARGRTLTGDAPLPGTHPYRGRTLTKDTLLPWTHPYHGHTLTKDTPLPKTHPYHGHTVTIDTPLPNCTYPMLCANSNLPLLEVSLPAETSVVMIQSKRTVLVLFFLLLIFVTATAGLLCQCFLGIRDFKSLVTCYRKVAKHE